jgi:hypothetical protein
MLPLEKKTALAVPRPFRIPCRARAAGNLIAARNHGIAAARPDVGNALAAGTGPGHW